MPVHSTDPSTGPTPEDLEKAAKLAEADGMRVRILLITNPNNPLGTIYPPEVMKAAIDWARSRTMHTIIDEVYALSCHEVSAVMFLYFACSLETNITMKYGQNNICTKGVGVGFRISIESIEE